MYVTLRKTQSFIIYRASCFICLVLYVTKSYLETFKELFIVMLYIIIKICYSTQNIFDLINLTEISEKAYITALK